MASQPIRLPPGPHATAFRALADWVESDPELSRVVRTFRSWKGDKAEDDLPEAQSQLPWLRLTPEMGPVEPFAALGGGLRSFLSPLTVAVEAAHAGSDAADSMRLWDRLYVRVMAWDANASAVSCVTPVAPAQSVNDADFTLARGAFRLDIYVTG